MLNACTNRKEGMIIRWVNCFLIVEQENSMIEHLFPLVQYDGLRDAEGDRNQDRHGYLSLAHLNMGSTWQVVDVTSAAEQLHQHAADQKRPTRGDQHPSELF
jgi:hypothetical protein